MTIPFPLISDITKGRCLPFVGAGFSKNAVLPDGLSMPDWLEMTALLSQDAETPADAAPPKVAERYEEKFGRVQMIETIRDSLHPDKAKPGRAHRAFVQLPFDTIYTTNFDLLLEDAYAEEGRPSRSLVGELQLPFHAGQTASSIIKMHGDLRHEEHITVTQRDYDTFLEKYPVIATHLSAMLITRTPLFIGYSLTDPDFQSIREVVRSRLGRFERMAYVVQFDVASDLVEAGFKEKVHIISLPSSAGKSRDEVLEDFFKNILAQCDAKSANTLRASRPDVFEPTEGVQVLSVSQSPEQSAVVESTSRLCFVMMPFGPKSDEVYRNIIAPAVQAQGLASVRADELSTPGFILEQIRSAIQQSRICIADLTGSNPNVFYEIGLAESLKKPLILMAEQGTKLPFDLAHQRVLLYGPDQEETVHLLRRAISIILADRLREAMQLVELGQYRAAIAAAAIALEQRLYDLLDLGQGTGLETRKSMRQMLGTLVKRAVLTAEDLAALEDVIDMRNRAVHAMGASDVEPSRVDAESAIATIQSFLDKTAWKPAS